MGRVGYQLVAAQQAHDYISPVAVITTVSLTMDDKTLLTEELYFNNGSIPVLAAESFTSKTNRN
jgi:hypothetical protein